MLQNNSRMILIAGPYMSGTNGDPKQMAANLSALELYAMPIYEAGHLPVIGEWLALPIVAQARQNSANRANKIECKDCTKEELSQKFFYPVANRLLTKCDAVLRVAGESKGADEDVRLALEMGKPVFYSLDELLKSNELKLN